MKIAANKKDSQSRVRAKPRDLAEWRQFRDELRSRQVRADEALSANATERKRLACAAALGDAAARREIADRSASDSAWQASLASLADAIAEADEAISGLEAQARQEARKAELGKLDLLLARRLEIAGAIEEDLRRLAERFEMLGGLGNDIHAAYLDLGGQRLILPPLAPGAIASRLSEFLFGLGFARWLPVSCAETKSPPASFRQEERSAQSVYALADGKARP